MLTLWHVAAPEEHFLTAWLRAALAEERRESDEAEEDFLSWEAPGAHGMVRWVRFPHFREGEATSRAKLARQLEADRAVVLRPSGGVGGVLQIGRSDRRWTWLGAPHEPGRDQPIALAPFEHEWEGPDPRRVAFVGGAALAEDWGSVRLMAAKVRDAGRWEPELSCDLPALSRNWPSEPGENTPVRRPPEIGPGTAAALVLLERGIEWSPWVLEACRNGRTVVAPDDSEYAGLLQEAGGHRWDGTLETLLRLLDSLAADPPAVARKLRLARAWSRRWRPERSLEELRRLAEETAALAQSERTAPNPGSPSAMPTPPPRPRAVGLGPVSGARQQRWTLRREIGIGDIIFTLAVGAELKRRDPKCHLTLHTHPQHREWVSWFPFVDRVTSGDFDPGPSERVGDFETNFPMHSRKDRTLALGEIIGVKPTAWPAAPSIPERARASAERLLRKSEGRPRIAFAPGSKNRAPVRSLPPHMAEPLATRLAALGDVVWLEEGKLESPPPGVLNLSGRCTPAQAVAVLEQCDLCVSVDSGLLYAAAALGKPVVGIFTHVGALQRLWLAPRFIALEPALPCAPCGEGPDAFHCRQLLPTEDGRPPREPVFLPCARLPWTDHVVDAVERIQRGSQDSRLLWRVGPNGERLEMAAEAIPPPWPGGENDG